MKRTIKSLLFFTTCFSLLSCKKEVINTERKGEEIISYWADKISKSYLQVEGDIIYHDTNSTGLDETYKAYSLKNRISPEKDYIEYIDFYTFERGEKHQHNYSKYHYNPETDSPLNKDSDGCTLDSLLNSDNTLNETHYAKKFDDYYLNPFKDIRSDNFEFIENSETTFKLKSLVKTKKIASKLAMLSYDENHPWNNMTFQQVDDDNLKLVLKTDPLVDENLSTDVTLTYNLTTFEQEAFGEIKPKDNASEGCGDDVQNAFDNMGKLKSYTITYNEKNEKDEVIKNYDTRIVISNDPNNSSNKIYCLLNEGEKNGFALFKDGMYHDYTYTIDDDGKYICSPSTYTVNMNMYRNNMLPIYSDVSGYFFSDLVDYEKYYLNLDNVLGSIYFYVYLLMDYDTKSEAITDYDADDMYVTLDSKGDYLKSLHYNLYELNKKDLKKQITLTYSKFNETTIDEIDFSQI